MVPTFGLEAHFVKLAAKEFDFHVPVINIFITYIATGFFILIVMQILLRCQTERTARISFIAGFCFLTWTANVLIYAATYFTPFEEWLYFIGIALINFCNCIVVIALVSNYFAAFKQASPCFAINLMNALNSAATICGRLLLSLEDTLSGGAIDSLDFSSFQTYALVNTLVAFPLAILLFKVKT